MNKVGYFLLGFLIGSLITYHFFDQPKIISETVVKEFKEGSFVSDTLVSNIEENFGFKDEEIKEVKNDLVSENKENFGFKDEKILVSKNETNPIRKFIVNKKIEDIEVEIEIFSVTKPDSIFVNIKAPVREIEKIKVDTLIITNTKLVEVGPTFEEKASYAGIGAGIVLLLLLL